MGKNNPYCRPNDLDSSPYLFVEATDRAIIEPRTHVLLMAFRQALIMILGAIEDYLEMERSIVPKRKR